MCGIAGLFAKRETLQPCLGAHLSAMLEQLAARGPDSTGVAFYREPAPDGSCKVSVFSPSPEPPWWELGEALRACFGEASDPRVIANHAIYQVAGEPDEVQEWLREIHPEVTVMSAGTTIEILKEVGSPIEFVRRFGLERIDGTHALGHTRMATESRVTKIGRAHV